LRLANIFTVVTLANMSNDPRSAHPITADQLSQLANELEMFTRTLRLCEEVAKTQSDRMLAIYNWASAEAGIKRLAAFVKAADESRRNAVLGKAIKPNQLKPRSTALKRAKKVAEPKEKYQQ
jgi:hypothetical protein